MRHLAIGDIHGCFKALTTLAAFVPFQPADVVITLGDYVNRGPDIGRQTSKARPAWDG
jgi:serine/threonine protein phosphatase 1